MDDARLLLSEALRPGSSWVKSAQKIIQVRRHGRDWVISRKNKQKGDSKLGSQGTKSHLAYRGRLQSK